jgi:hypothetical protein
MPVSRLPATTSKKSSKNSHGSPTLISGLLLESVHSKKWVDLPFLGDQVVPIRILLHVLPMADFPTDPKATNTFATSSTAWDSLIRKLWLSVVLTPLDDATLTDPDSKGYNLLVKANADFSLGPSLLPFSLTIIISSF